MSQSNSLVVRNLPEDMTLCHYCKKPIMIEDKICKNCYEYQKDEDRKEEQETNLKNSCLSISDWVTVLFFQLIGISIGIVHFFNGEKNRGKKVIRFSLLSIFINIIVGGSIFFIFQRIIKILRSGLD